MKTKNKVTRSLWLYLGPALFVLGIFGTIGNVNSKTMNDDSLDHIALYRDVVDNQIISILEAAFTKSSTAENNFDEAANSPEDYFHNGDESVPIYTSLEVKEVIKEVKEKVKKKEFIDWNKLLGSTFAAEDYFHNGGESIPIFTSPEGEETTLEDFRFFRGEIKKVKNCIVYFKVNGKVLQIPVAHVAGYIISDKNSKLNAIFKDMEAQNYCAEGTNDATKYHRSNGWYWGGFLFGVFAVIPALVVEPSPRGNSPYYSDTSYIMCYGRKAKSMNIVSVLYGWLTWVVVLVVAVLIA